MWRGIGNQLLWVLLFDFLRTLGYGGCCLLLRAMQVTFLAVSWGLGTPEETHSLTPRDIIHPTSGWQAQCDPGRSLPMGQAGHILQCLLPCS